MLKTQLARLTLSGLLMLSPWAWAHGGICTKALVGGVTLEAPEIPTLLLQTMKALPAESEIPSHVYQKYSIDDIARAIVSEIQLDEIQHKDKVAEKSPVPVDLMNEADIILFFWNADIDSIESKGFLNQHLSGKSKGTYNPSYRKAAEDYFTGFRMGGSLASMHLRPKSAFVNIRANKKLAAMGHEIVSQYGNIGAVLKPELKWRSMWTAGDSLGIGGYSTKAPDRRAMLPARGTYLRGSIPGQPSSSSYYEALIYGKVSFQDVDYFLVTHGAFAPALKKFGRPIYLGVKGSVHGRTVFNKGSLLFAGVDLKLPDEKPAVAAVPKVEEPPAPKATTPHAVFSEMLATAGIKDKVTWSNRGFVKRDELEFSHVRTTGSDYVIMTPRKEDVKFSEYTTEIQTSAKTLQDLGIPFRKIILATDQFLLQQGFDEDTALAKVPKADREQVLKPLQNLISKLVESKVYIKGLRPSFLDITKSGQMILRAHDGLRQKSKSQKVAKRFRENLAKHWKSYFDEDTFAKLNAYLEGISPD
ncbi:MAG: hypothetical protein AB7F86_03940 [Bdellovibrionales bacterium]